MPVDTMAIPLFCLLLPIVEPARAELTGNVKFVFQPAEEYIGGARLMVNEGVMKGVDGIIGLHLGADRPFGTIGVRPGSVYASSDSFVSTVKGNGGHAASPHVSRSHYHCRLSYHGLANTD